MRSADTIRRWFALCIVRACLVTKYAYTHTATSLASIERAISKQRLGKYLDYADGDLEKALELHSWNCDLGAALHVPIQYLELVLRNACHKELEDIFGRDDWFNALPTGPKIIPGSVPRRHVKDICGRYFHRVLQSLCLKPPDKPVDLSSWDYLHGEIKTVKGRLMQQGRDPNNPPCVVAALSFGFWVAIFTKKLEQQFYRAGAGKGLYKVIESQAKTRKLRHKFHSKLERLKGLRNRIAHHEPLFHNDLGKAHQLIITTASYIDQDAADWIAYHSQFSSVWNNPPTLTPAQLTRLRTTQTQDRYFNV